MSSLSGTISAIDLDFITDQCKNVFEMMVLLDCCFYMVGKCLSCGTSGRIESRAMESIESIGQIPPVSLSSSKCNLGADIDMEI